eukprot:919914-Pyramimonas_sp.AAC.1
MRRLGSVQNPESEGTIWNREIFPGELWEAPQQRCRNAGRTASMRACTRAVTRGSLLGALPDQLPARRSRCEACGATERSSWRAPPPSGF